VSGGGGGGVGGGGGGGGGGGAFFLSASGRGVKSSQKGMIVFINNHPLLAALNSSSRGRSNALQ